MATCDCGQILKLFGHTRNPVLAERTSKVCLLLPDLLEETDLPVKLAEVAVREGANHQFIRFFELAHGLAQYRVGRFASAAEVLGRSVERGPFGDVYLQTATHLTLAMAHHQLGDPEESRVHWDKTSELFERRLPDLDSGDLGAGWFDWFICNLLRREAQQLLGSH